MHSQMTAASVLRETFFWTKRMGYKPALTLLAILLLLALVSNALAGGRMQALTFRQDIHVFIERPDWPKDKPAGLILYALPNGNSIAQTYGKRLTPGEDWHYDIQHVGAQYRFLQQLNLPYNPVLVLLQTRQKSWPAWKKDHPNDHSQIVAALIDTLCSFFPGKQTQVILSSHSGGGRFIFSFLDGVQEIPEYARRIVFIDSNYGWESDYAAPVGTWLQQDRHHALMVFAYDDSVALLNGKRFVSDTGGTWYRSHRMIGDLARAFRFTRESDTSFTRYSALKGRVRFYLKENPNRGIWHTEQVARNGLIHALLAGSKFENRGYRYWDERAYSALIRDSLLPEQIELPGRRARAASGSSFIQRVRELDFPAREKVIAREILSGNLPAFLRRYQIIEETWSNARGDSHRCAFAVLPDYLAIGGDTDLVRMPMGPVTAQYIADSLGAMLPTPKMVDAIYKQAPVKLRPQPIKPVANLNEQPETFLRHQSMIQAQLDSLSAGTAPFMAGHKKDVVISTLAGDTTRPHHVILYGWHQPDGTPIQPLTNIHKNSYVDYSHGIRLVCRIVLVDGVPMDLHDLLQDAVLFRLFSDEEKPLAAGYEYSRPVFQSP